MPNILVAESLYMPTLQSYLTSHRGFLFEDQMLDKYKDSGKDFNFYYNPDITPEEIEKNTKYYDCLVVRPKEVSAKSISSASKLKLIVRGGAGLNSIDLAAAEKKGVVVQNTPGQNAVTTAEFTFNLIMKLAANRHINKAQQDLLDGNPQEVETYMGRELLEQSIAIIGLGSIGSLVAKYADAFGMKVSFCANSKKRNSYKQYDDIRHLLATQPDVVCLHIPLTPETDKVIGKEELSLLKDSTVLINTARPQLICPDAFGEALDNNIIGSFAIDGDEDLVEPFLKIDTQHKGIITHHIADTTHQAQHKITTAVLEKIWKFFQ